MIGCRTLLIMIAGLLLHAPLAALAQSRAKPPVIGVISVPVSSSAPPSISSYDAFRQALRGLGYIEGQTIVLENRRAAGGQFDDYLAVAEEFVRQRVDIIFASVLSSNAWYPFLRASSVSRARRSLARIASAFLVQTKGFGSALWRSR